MLQAWLLSGVVENLVMNPDFITPKPVVPAVIDHLKRHDSLSPARTHSVVLIICEHPGLRASDYLFIYSSFGFMRQGLPV